MQTLDVTRTIDAMRTVAALQELSSEVEWDSSPVACTFDTGNDCDERYTTPSGHPLMCTLCSPVSCHLTGA